MIVVNGRTLRFTIGDVVYFRTDVVGGDDVPTPYLVIGYVIEESSSMPVIRNSTEEHRVHEFELTDNKYDQE